MEVLADAVRYAMDMGVLSKMVDELASSRVILEGSMVGLDTQWLLRAPGCKHTPEARLNVYVQWLT